MNDLFRRRRNADAKVKTELAKSLNIHFILVFCKLEASAIRFISIFANAKLAREKQNGVYSTPLCRKTRGSCDLRLSVDSSTKF